MNTTPQTFIFIGRSGCGKGTQAALLRDVLEKNTPNMNVFYLETGARFREFIDTPTHSSTLSKEIMERGALQPEFLAVWNWAHLFIENLKGNEHMILDGTPRKLDEAEVLDSAMCFYGREKPYVIFLDVSREFSLARFKERGRADDKSLHAIDARMQWYDEHVVPAVRFYWQNPKYTLVHINGEQPIDVVHAEIMQKINLTENE